MGQPARELLSSASDIKGAENGARQRSHRARRRARRERGPQPRDAIEDAAVLPRSLAARWNCRVAHLVM